MSRTFRTNFAFNATGLNSLLRARNIVSSLGGTSWGAFNQAARGASSASREFAKLAGAMGGGIGFGMLTNGLLRANAELNTNKLIFQEMVGDSKEGLKEANAMVSMLQDNAAKYGYDISEVMKSARGLYAGFAGGNRKVDTEDLERLLKLVMTANSLEVENRGLSFTAFSFKEIAQALGKGDYKSIQNRLEITFTVATQQAITKALKSGDTKKAIDLLYKGMEEAKASPRILEKMAEQGFFQNANALKSYAERIMLALGDTTTERMTKGMVGIRKALSEHFKPDSLFLTSFKGYSDNIADNLESVIKPAFEGIRKWLYSTAGMTFFDTISQSFELIGQIGKEALIVIGAFFDGLGIHTEKAQVDFQKFATTVLNEVKEMMPKLQPFAEALGILVRAVADLVIQQPELAAMLLTFKMFGVTSMIGGLAKLTASLGALGAAAGTAGTAGAAGNVGLLTLAMRRLSGPVLGGGLATSFSQLRIAMGSVALVLGGPLGLTLLLGALAAACIYAFSQTEAGEKFFGSMFDWLVKVNAKLKEHLGLLPKGAAAQLDGKTAAFSKGQLEAVANRQADRRLTGEEHKMIAALENSDQLKNAIEMAKIQKIKPTGQMQLQADPLLANGVSMGANKNPPLMHQLSQWWNSLNHGVPAGFKGVNPGNHMTAMYSDANRLNASRQTTTPTKTEVGLAKQDSAAIAAVVKKPTSITQNNTWNITGQTDPEKLAKDAAVKLRQGMQAGGLRLDENG